MYAQAQQAPQGAGGQPFTEGAGPGAGSSTGGPQADEDVVEAEIVDEPGEGKSA